MKNFNNFEGGKTIEAEPEIIDLDDIIISMEVFEGWKEMAKEMALRLIKDGVDPKTIPDEQARINASGDLELFIKLPDGKEFEMKIARNQWSYKQ